jgi:non-specific serine/threonine protein kinase/serine/threonine-protein kinase
MTDARFARMRRLFEEALRIEPASREAFLSGACGSDRELADEIRSLLGRDAAASGAVRTGAMRDAAARMLDLPPPRPDERLGKYRLLERLGEGGMGYVHRAEQETPLRRTVAVKILRSCLAGSDAMLRFRVEQQTLALMNHPYIAKVLDAGVTAGGQAYFVMEYIEGEPITVWCERRGLAVPERLELFVRVCEGIQHAHRNAVIHRDIKPSNVLVSDVEGRPVPRIIDFGVAKAPAALAGEAVPETLAGAVLGTPDYMSPEQASFGAGAVDTRSDVYSLGVLLYELLAGSRPFKAGADGLEGLLQRIRTAEPIRPSAACGPRRGKGLRGDLDWIVLKAMDKDPARRYTSPLDLAADITRHLRAEPVAAGPPGALYRAGRFIRRHRLPTALAATLLFTLIGSVLVVSVQAARLAREADRANAEAAEATQMAEFLLRLFRPTGDGDLPEGAYPRSLSQTLDLASNEIRNGLGGFPLLRARLLHALGDTYMKTRRPYETIELLKEAGRVLDSVDQPDGGLRTSITLSMAQVYMSMNDYGRAETLLLEVIEERTRRLGGQHPDTLRAILRLAGTYHWMKRPREAFDRVVAAEQGLARSLGEDHPEALESRGLKGAVLLELGRYGEAAAVLREVVRRNPRLAIPLYNLGCALANQDRRDDALELISRSIDLGFVYPGGLFQDPHLRVLRHDPGLAVLERRMRYTGTNYYDLLKGIAMDRRLGRHDAAARRLEGALAGIRRAVHDPVHWAVVDCSRQLADLYLERGRVAEARAVLLPLVDPLRKAGPEFDGDHLPSILWRLAQCDLAEGNGREALGRLDESVESPGALSNLANVKAYVQAFRAVVGGDREGALSHLERALELGYSDAGWLRRDLAFRTLHGDPRFEAILREVEKLEL